MAGGWAQQQFPLLHLQKGVVFSSLAIAKELIARTKTSTGLAVTVAIFDQVYETDRKVSQAFRENMPIVFDDYLPSWNYRAIPQLVDGTVI